MSAKLLTSGLLFTISSAALAQADADGVQWTALPNRSGDEQPRFESLGPDETGIDFVHQWSPPPKYERYVKTAFAGGGVCIGDYDGDGWADIFLTRPFGGNRLYRNKGGFQFEDVTERAGLNQEPFWGTGPSFADIDNDGNLDLYVCGFDCANRFHLNRGDGTFQENAQPAGLDFHGASVIMAFADYDLDGDLDGYLLTNRTEPPKKKIRFHATPIGRGRWKVGEEIREWFGAMSDLQGNPSPTKAGQSDHLFRNNGDGTFTDVSSEVGMDGGYYPGLSATWWDYNRDNLPDLYVANDFKAPDHLYRNNGDGTFEDVVGEVLPHTPWYSMGADAADINNDGKIDLLAADMAATTHYKSKMSMGDMNLNGWFLESATPRQYMRNALYLNSGTDRFMEAAQLAGISKTDWTWAIKFADLDCDGWVDLFITNGMTRDYMNGDLMTKSTQMMQVGLMPYVDLSEIPVREEKNLAYRNQGDLRFESVGEDWGLDQLSISYGAAVGDLDNDGDLDLVINNFQAAPTVYRNQLADGHRVKIRLIGTESNDWGIGATLYLHSDAGIQSRYLTLSRGFMSADEPVVHFGLGKSEKIDRLEVQWPSGAVQRFKDLPVDRFYTITEPSTPPSVAATPAAAPAMFKPSPSRELRLVSHDEKPYNDYMHQPLLPAKLSQLGPGLAIADVDGDGDEDIFLGGARGQPGKLRLKTGAGEFEFTSQTALHDDFATEDMAPLFFDADSDGDLDLYVVSGSVECEPGNVILQDRLYLNDGSGNLSADASDDLLPPARDSGSVVTAADYDRDGDLDLFLGGRTIPGEYPLAPDSRLLRNDAGRFTDVTDKIAPGLRQTGMVTSAIWSDADGNGWVDLLVVHEWGPVKIWINREGQLAEETEAAGLSQRQGWWNGIAARDIDNDGDIDYVVTNAGLNSKYHASAEKPALLYYGDFDNSGTKQLIEADYEGQTLYPVRGKSCSTNAMPHLGEKFTTFHDFALASLKDIYTSQCLEESVRFEADTLESGVLLNDGKGRFEFSLLPRLAQISPAYGVVLTEVNGDGNADLYLVHNSFSPQRETGRMDGGVSLLLVGKGDGTFEPLWPDQSGLVVPGDAKGLVVTDLNDDGWADFVVSNNDGPLQAFENQGHPENRTLKLQLKGRKGNPTAVGAIVTVTLDDGHRQTAEVHAGGGYLSQSSPHLFFGLGNRQQVESVQVRWPDGQTTSHKKGLDAPLQQPE